MNSVLIAGAGLLLVFILLWFAAKRNRQIGSLKSENQALKESREQSEDANKVESDIDRLSITDQRDELRKKWSQQSVQ